MGTPEMESTEKLAEFAAIVRARADVLANKMLLDWELDVTTAVQTCIRHRDVEIETNLGRIIRNQGTKIEAVKELRGLHPGLSLRQLKTAVEVVMGASVSGS